MPKRHLFLVFVMISVNIGMNFVEKKKKKRNFHKAKSWFINWFIYLILHRYGEIKWSLTFYSVPPEV